MKKFIFIILTCFNLAIACKDDETPYCELPLDALSDSFAFKLVNENGNTIIGEFNTLYDHKDIAMTDDNGNTPFLFKVQDGGTVSWIIPTANDPLGELIEKNYFLILPETNNLKEDIDTIHTSYKLVLNECGFHWYEFFELSYNDSLYVSGEFPPSRINILKH